jgi:hypothetical protein
MQERSVRQRCLHGDRVVAHGAVAQRAAAAGIVAGHAADGGAGGGRDVHRKPQAMPAKLPVEVIEHDARLHQAGPLLDIERQDAVQVLRNVDDDAVVDHLTALRGAAPARRHHEAVVARDRQCAQRLVRRARHDHAGWHDLIERRVGGITPAARAIEQQLAGDLGGKAPRKIVRAFGLRFGCCGGSHFGLNNLGTCALSSLAEVNAIRTSPIRAVLRHGTTMM